jgi:hypothetical protein
MYLTDLALEDLLASESDGNNLTHSKEVALKRGLEMRRQLRLRHLRNDIALHLSLGLQ